MICYVISTTTAAAPARSAGWSRLVMVEIFEIERVRRKSVVKNVAKSVVKNKCGEKREEAKSMAKFKSFPPKRGFEFNFSKVSRQNEGSNSTFQKKVFPLNAHAHTPHSLPFSAAAVAATSDISLSLCPFAAFNHCTDNSIPIGSYLLSSGLLLHPVGTGTTIPFIDSR